MRAYPPSAFLNEQGKGQQSFSSVQFSGGTVTILVKPVILRRLGTNYGGSFTRSLMFPVGNTVHRRHQRVTLLRVGF